MSKIPLFPNLSAILASLLGVGKYNLSDTLDKNIPAGIYGIASTSGMPGGPGGVTINYAVLYVIETASSYYQMQILTNSDSSSWIRFANRQLGQRGTWLKITP